MLVRNPGFSLAACRSKTPEALQEKHFSLRSAITVMPIVSGFQLNLSDRLLAALAVI
jgi:hypothetical protein